MIRKLKALYFGRGLASVLSRAITGSAGIRLIGMALGFLVGIQLARGLGAEGYGVYGVTMSIVALLTIPAEFGMATLLIREIADARVRNDWRRIRALVRWCSWSAIKIALLVWVSVYVLIQVFADESNGILTDSLLAGMVLVPMVAQISINGAALRGLHFVVRGQLPDVIFRPLFFSLLLFLSVLLFGVVLTPVLALSLSSLAGVITLVASWYMLRKAVPVAANERKYELDVKGLWLSTFPMALTEGMRVFQGQVSMLIAGYVLPMDAVGVFRVAAAIAVLVSTPITLFNVVGSSMIARSVAENDRAGLQRLLGLLALGMTLGVGFFVLPFHFIGDWLVAYFFGIEFVPAVDVVLILGYGSVFGSLAGASVWLLNMAGCQRLVTRSTFVSLLFLVASLPAGAISYGVHGIAFCTSASYVLWNALLWRSGVKVLGVDSSVFSLMRSRAMS